MDTHVGIATDPVYDISKASRRLWNASRRGDMAGVLRALDSGGINRTNIDELFRIGYDETTALFEAVGRRHVYGEDRRMSAEIARILIRHGANPSTFTGQGSTPLHGVVLDCAGTSALRSMIEDCPNLNLNVRDRDGRTALFLGIAYDIPSREDEIVTLLQHRADPSIPDRAGNTILHLCHSLFISNMVLDGPIPVDINARNNHGETALFSLIRSADWSTNDDGNSGGIVALELMKRGADPRIPANDGNTVLHLRLNKTLLSGILNNPIRIDINFHNNRGETPLHMAVATNNIYTVDVLLAHGADINLRDVYGETPLDWANRQGVKMQEMIQYRIRNTAFVMGHQDRLGEHSLVRWLPEELIRQKKLNHLTL